MRKSFYLFLAITLFCINTYAQENSELFPFTITGEITGLEPGDTLSFEKVIFPDWEMKPAFDVIINESDRFVYSGSYPHTQYYLMTYKPVSEKIRKADRRGLTLLIRENDKITIRGTTDHIYYCRLEGGLFDDPGLQEMMDLEKSLGMQRGDVAGMIEEARLANDSLKMKEYSEKFNLFHADHREDFEKVRQLENDAPYFKLTTVDGKEISSDDFAGKYILIYHWGLCPGSIMIDGEVSKLSQKYKDHVAVIGVTESLDMIRKVHETTNPGDKVYNMELKPVLENMLSHPWYDSEIITGNNKAIKQDYAFAGLPYFIFISPDRKIIMRGFQEAALKAKEVMETELENLNLQSLQP